MKLHTTSSVDERVWECHLQRFNTPLFHSPAWARYRIAEQPSLQPLYCSLLDEDGSVRGVSLLFREASPNPLVRSLTLKMHTDAHPAVGDGAASIFPHFLEQIEQYARGEGAVELTIGSFGTPGNESTLEGLGYTLKHRCEFALPLDRSLDDIWGGMERRRRRTIQKAETMGVTVAHLPMEEGIAHLRRLQVFTTERVNQRGAGVQLGTTRPLAEDPAIGLVTADVGDLIGASHDGQIVSVSLFTRLNGLVYSTQAGHAPEAYKTQAYSLLLWKAIQHYKTSGARRFNLGGVPAGAEDPASPDHGLYEFKVGLGFVREDCASGSKVLSSSRAKLAAGLKAIMGR